MRVLVAFKKNMLRQLLERNTGLFDPCNALRILFQRFVFHWFLGRTESRQGGA